MHHTTAKTLRDRRKLDITHVAQQIGVHRDALLAFERGESDLEDAVLEKLKRILGYVEDFHFSL